MRFTRTILSLTIGMLLASPALASGPSARELRLDAYYDIDDVFVVEVDIPRTDAGRIEIRIYRDLSSAQDGDDYQALDVHRRWGLAILTPQLIWDDADLLWVELWRKSGRYAVRDLSVAPVDVPNLADLPIGTPYGDDMVFTDDNPFSAMNDPRGGIDDFGDPFDYGDGSNPDEPGQPDGRNSFGQDQPDGSLDFGDGSSDDQADDPRNGPGLGNPDDGSDDYGDGSIDEPGQPDGRNGFDQGNPDGSLDFGDGSGSTGTPDDGRILPTGQGDTHDTGDGGDRTMQDCNGNGLDDRDELAFDPGLDYNGNGLIDRCERPGDVDGDDQVNVRDLILVIQRWGNCAACPEDLNGDTLVNVLDLLEVVMNWSD